MEPAKTSPINSDAALIVKKTLKQVYNDAVFSPGLMVGNTDTRHFWNVSKNIFRFMPMLIESKDVPRYHGLNERISLANVRNVANFFFNLILNFDSQTFNEARSEL